MSSSPSFGVEYLSPTELPLQSDSWWDSVLGLAHFDSQPIARSADHVPVAEVAIAPLVTSDGVCEVWRADGSTRSGRVGDVQFRASEQLLFGCISVPEHIVPGGPDDKHSPLELATIRAYTDIFTALDKVGYRSWCAFGIMYPPSMRMGAKENATGSSIEHAKRAFSQGNDRLLKPYRLVSVGHSNREPAVSASSPLADPIIPSDTGRFWCTLTPPLTSHRCCRVLHWSTGRRCGLSALGLRLARVVSPAH
jgi:hypothetical protein